jgi:hypothetical protein
METMIPSTPTTYQVILVASSSIRGKRLCIVDPSVIVSQYDRVFNGIAEAGNRRHRDGEREFDFQLGPIRSNFGTGGFIRKCKPLQHGASGRAVGIGCCATGRVAPKRPIKSAEVTCAMAKEFGRTIQMFRLFAFELAYCTCGNINQGKYCSLP